MRVRLTKMIRILIKFHTHKISQYPNNNNNKTPVLYPLIPINTSIKISTPHPSYSANNQYKSSSNNEHNLNHNHNQINYPTETSHLFIILIFITYTLYIPNLTISLITYHQNHNKIIINFINSKTYSF